MKQASCGHVGGYRRAIVDLYQSDNLKGRHIAWFVHQYVFHSCCQQRSSI